MHFNLSSLYSKYVQEKENMFTSFDYNLKTDAASALSIFESYVGKGQIAGTSDKIYRDKRGYRIGNEHGRGRFYYRISVDGNRLHFALNISSIFFFIVVFLAVIFFSVMTVALLFADELIQGKLVFIGITVCLICFVLLQYGHYKSIQRTVESILEAGLNASYETSYEASYEAGLGVTAANSIAAKLEAKINTPVTDNLAVTVRKSEAGYTIGWFGMWPIYYYVQMEDGLVKLKGNVLGIFVRCFYYFLVLLSFGFSCYILIKILKGIIGGGVFIIFILGFLDFIFLLQATTPIIRKKQIDQFLS